MRGLAAGSETGSVEVPVVDLELSAGGPTPSPNARGEIWALVRLHGVPLGVLTLRSPGSEVTDLRAWAHHELRPAVARHLALDGLSPDAWRAECGGPTAPCASATRPSRLSVTVVVCTLGKEPRLLRTVESLLLQTHPTLDVVVVDNQPGSGAARPLLAGVREPRLRIIDEPRRGLSAARNAGLAAASGEVVAFTDDDAFADPEWITRLVAPFEVDPDVVCTTGLVLPAELSTPAQLWFEEFGAFDKGFEPIVWSVAPVPRAAARLGQPGEGGVLFPYSAGVYGSGNNMAFRVDWLRTQPLFDEALGAGSLTRGGEDLDAFLRVMLDGRTLVYVPAALVWHSARSDLPALHDQLYGYGSGMAAMVTKYALQPRQAAAIGRRLPAGLRKLLDPGSEKNAGRSPTFLASLKRAELRGYAAGPLLYARSRRRLRRGDQDGSP